MSTSAASARPVRLVPRGFGETSRRDLWWVQPLVVFLALGLEPLVSRLMDRGLRRGWAVVVVMLSLLTILAFIGWMVVPTFAQQIGSLVDKTPRYLDDIQHNRLVEQFDNRFHVVERAQERATKSIRSPLENPVSAVKALHIRMSAVISVRLPKRSASQPAGTCASA